MKRGSDEEFAKNFELKKTKYDFLKESDRFEFRCRVQLNTGNAKTDTYFAFDKKNNNRKVVVKGPFLNTNQYMTYMKLVNFKKMNIFCGIQSIETEIVFLIPDLLKSPLGMRNKIEKEKEYAFLVFEDKCNLDVIPTYKRKSKVWDETDVFDSDKCKSCLFCAPSVIKNCENALFSFVLNSIFRLVFEITDPALRNFLYIPDEKIVYSIDEDNYFGGKSDKLWYNMKSSELLMVYKFVKNNCDDILQKLGEWIQNLTEKNQEIEILIGSANFQKLSDNLQYICNRENLVECVKKSTRKTDVMWD